MECTYSNVHRSEELWNRRNQNILSKFCEDDFRIRCFDVWRMTTPRICPNSFNGRCYCCFNFIFFGPLLIVWLTIEWMITITMHFPNRKSPKTKMDRFNSNDVFCIRTRCRSTDRRNIFFDNHFAAEQAKETKNHCDWKWHNLLSSFLSNFFSSVNRCRYLQALLVSGEIYHIECQLNQMKWEKKHFSDLYCET